MGSNGSSVGLIERELSHFHTISHFPGQRVSLCVRFFFRTGYSHILPKYLTLGGRRGDLGFEMRGHGRSGGEWVGSKMEVKEEKMRRLYI
jgi:hypothetical protein